MLYILLAVAFLLAIALYIFWELEKKLIYTPIYHDERGFITQSNANYFLQHIEVQTGVHLESLIYEPHEKVKVNLLYYGGKQQDSVSLVSKLAQNFPDCRIIAYNYRAYGKSGGKLTHKNILEDALQVFDFYQARYEAISILGYSLGSAVSSYVASKREAKHLFLVSAFDSINAVIRVKYPLVPLALLQNSFESARYVQEVAAPTYLYVTMDDEVVDIEHARELHRAIKNLVDYKEFNGYNHNSILLSSDIATEINRVLHG